MFCVCVRDFREPKKPVPRGGKGNRPEWDVNTVAEPHLTDAGIPRAKGCPAGGRQASWVRVVGTPAGIGPPKSPTGLAWSSWHIWGTHREPAFS